ncbi:MAG: hypothetical protein II909_00425 [Kiritimatiellae bacterium]|nr:hypothetical protein [Kiritimatiellia bacterium]
MPLGINSYNDAFKAFTDFATQAKSGSTFAQIDGEKNTVAGNGPLAGRTIVAKTAFDFVGNVGRGTDSRKVNNDVRDLFKQAVAEMFGGPDKIPASVQDAMKLEDFGNGKPLSARRILAVKSAVDQVAEQFKSGVETNKATFAEDYPTGQANKLIETAFTACQGNTDAMDIVNKSMRLIIINAGGQFRSEEAVRKTVEGLISNLNELKALSTKNPGIYAAGKQMLREPCKPLPKGMLTKMVQAINNTSINDLRKLSGSSSGMYIHKTTIQFFRNINEIMISSGAEKILDGADEKEAVRLFIADSLLSRCSQGTLGKISDALNSNTAAQLRDFYAKCNSEDTNLFNKEAPNIQGGTRVVGGAAFTYLNNLEVSINRNLQRLNPNAKSAEVINDDPEIKFNLEHLGGKELVADMISLAKESNERDAKVLIDRLVDGSGRGADAFKTLLKKKLGDVNLPTDYLPQRLKDNVKAMMNWNICGEMKRLAQGEMSQFQKDVYRSGKITLIDGEKSFTLSKNFNEARNELAQFITGNQQATYESLTAPEDKNKVHLMMAMLCQETEKAGENGVMHALHPRESEDAFILGGDDPGTRTFTLEKRPDGALMLNYSMEKLITDIRPVDDFDDISVGDGSSFNCSLNYELSGDEVQRLAKLDFTKFNDKEASNLTNNYTQDMPDGTKQFAEGKLMKAVQTFAPEFQINAGGGTLFEIRLNPTLEEGIAQQRTEGPIHV